MVDTTATAVKPAVAPAKIGVAAPSLAPPPQHRYLGLLCIVPYTVATALQDTHIKAACIAGTAAAGGIILIRMALKRSAGPGWWWPHFLDAYLFLVFMVQLIVVEVRGGRYADTIVRYFPFITNSALAGMALISLWIMRPFTIQDVRGTIPRDDWHHPAVRAAAFLTAGVWLLTFTINTALYLIPFIMGDDDHHFSAANLLCRLILPILLFAAAAAFACMWPLTVEAHLDRSDAFDAAPKQAGLSTAVASDVDADNGTSAHPSEGSLAWP